jgi:hypothetical protein
MTKLTAAELDRAIASQMQQFVADQMQQFVADNAGPEPEGPLAALNPSGYRPSDHIIQTYRNGQPIAGEDVADNTDPPSGRHLGWQFALALSLAIVCLAAALWKALA